MTHNPIDRFEATALLTWLAAWPDGYSFNELLDFLEEDRAQEYGIYFEIEAMDSKEVFDRISDLEHTLRTCFEVKK